MKLKLIIAALAFVSTAAHATCTGTGSFRTCTDNKSGNVYNTYSTPSYSTTNGRNLQNGSNWSQQTYRYGGGSSYTSGRDSHGRSWDQRTQQMGNSTIYSGRDASGTSYYYTCNQAGCY